MKMKVWKVQVFMILFTKDLPYERIQNYHHYMCVDTISNHKIWLIIYNNHWPKSNGVVTKYWLKLEIMYTISFLCTVDLGK